MAVEIVMPKLGWTMEEGVLAEWIKRDGETVAVGDVLFTVESDKALNEVESFENGILRIGPDSPPPGSTVPVGGLLAYIVKTGERAPFESMGETHRLETAASEAQSLHRDAASGPSQATSKAAGSIPTEPQMNNQGSGGINPPATGNHVRIPRHKISPRARRAADELGIDLTSIKGSGRGGRVVERDVRAAQVATPPRTTGRALPATRRLISERMMAGAHSTAPVTLTTEVDATELVRLRAQLKGDPNAAQQPIPSYTDLMAKLVADALGEHPALNARLEGDRVINSPAVHIGLAVDTERGLLVPVVRDVQSQSPRQIAQVAAGLIERARAGRLTAGEMSGSTFTLTNLGMHEIDAFTPIINLPECAILGLGRIQAKQVVVDAAAERVAIRQMMFLSLTFDHRLVDGAPAARCLQRIKQLVEQPYLWLVT